MPRAAQIAAVAVAAIAGVAIAAAAGGSHQLAASTSSPVASPLASPAASSLSEPSAEAPFAVVEIAGRDYEPGGLTVERGTTVYWVNKDGNAHTATDHDGAFDSGNLSAGAVWSFTFDEPGRYAYGCDYHLDMAGSVRVTEEGQLVEPAAAGSPTAPSHRER